MTSRKARRNSIQNGTKAKANVKKQLIVMLISVVLMVFSVTQVFYLARYTLGYDVPEEKLGVFRWFYMLFNGDNATVDK